MGCLFCDKSIDGKILTKSGYHKSCELEVKSRIRNKKCVFCGINPSPGGPAVSCCDYIYRNYPGT